MWSPKITRHFAGLGMLVILAWVITFGLPKFLPRFQLGKGSLCFLSKYYCVMQHKCVMPYPRGGFILEISKVIIFYDFLDSGHCHKTRLSSCFSNYCVIYELNYLVWGKQ